MVNIRDLSPKAIIIKASRQEKYSKKIAGTVTLIARKGRIVYFESKGESQLA